MLPFGLVESTRVQLAMLPYLPALIVGHVCSLQHGLPLVLLLV